MRNRFSRGIKLLLAKQERPNARRVQECLRLGNTGRSAWLLRTVLGTIGRLWHQWLWERITFKLL
jgi:hypothetical protein